MSNRNSAQGGLTRRGFLRATGAAAALGAMSGLAGCSSASESSQLAEAGSEEQVFRGVCRPNCFAFCHLNLHVRDGKLVKTSRGEYNESCYTRICQRGLSHVHRIYDPERVLHPLKRVEGTERGAGEWERISWDEAFEAVANEIKNAQDKYGKSSVSFYSISGNKAAAMDNAYNRFKALLNATTISMAVDMASVFGFTRHAGAALTGMANSLWEGNEPTDMKNAKTIVTWGANVTDGQIHNWHLVKEAMESGVKLVVVDPTFTQIAAKADKWISIRPGTDAALKYGVMNIALEKGVEDRDFIRDHTCAPFLVRDDTKKFLRLCDIEGGEEEDSPVVVLDSGTLVPLDQAVAPEVEGEYEFSGIKCRTAYSILKDEIALWTPEKVSETTDIPLETIYEFADICFDRPVFHYEGYGPQAYSNGVHSTSTGFLMCALLGNMGYSGASYGAFWTQFAGLDKAYGAPCENPTPGINTVDLKNIIEAGSYKGTPLDLKVLWVYCGNPVSTCCETNVWTQTIIPNLDCLIVADSAMTDTARYADYVLPIAQFFEVEEVAYAGQTASLHYSEKAIDSPGEAKSDIDVIAGVAEKLGLGEYFVKKPREILDELLSSKMCKENGVSLERLLAERQIRFLPGDAETNPHVAWEGGVFNSPSQRFEFYVESPVPRAATSVEPTEDEIERERIPRFFPPHEAWFENPLYEQYPLVCMSERPRYRVHSQWFSTPLLRELDPEPVVKINPKDASDRGIEDGAYVECFNDRGHAVAKAIYSEAIRPGTLVYPKNWQAYQHKAGSWSELTSTEFDVFGVNYNFMDVLCDARIWSDGGEE